MVDYNMTEADQAELVKKWWNQYGAVTIFAIVIAVLIVVGWHYYQRHQTNRSNQAALAYSQMLSSTQSQPKQAAAKAKVLLNDYKSTPYAIFAGFWLAKNAVDNKQLTAAEQYLSSVMAQSKGAWHDLAAVRLANVYVADHQAAKATSTLGEVSKNSVFIALVWKVRGDIAVEKKDQTAASQAYQKALALLPHDSSAYLVVQHHLANLPIAPSTTGVKK